MKLPFKHNPFLLYRHLGLFLFALALLGGLSFIHVPKTDAHISDCNLSVNHILNGPDGNGNYTAFISGQVIGCLPSHYINLRYDTYGVTGMPAQKCSSPGVGCIGFSAPDNNSVAMAIVNSIWTPQTGASSYLLGQLRANGTLSTNSSIPYTQLVNYQNNVNTWGVGTFLAPFYWGNYYFDEQTFFSGTYVCNNGQQIPFSVSVSTRSCVSTPSSVGGSYYDSQCSPGGPHHVDAPPISCTDGEVVNVPTMDTPPPPSQPTITSVTTGPCLSGQITVVWTAVSGASYYRLLVDGSGVYKVTSGTSFVYLSPNNGTQHSFQVSAIDINDNDSLPSNIAYGNEPTTCSLSNLTASTPTVTGTAPVSGLTNSFAEGSTIYLNANINNISGTDVSNTFNNSFEYTTDTSLSAPSQKYSTANNGSWYADGVNWFALTPSYSLSGLNKNQTKAIPSPGAPSASHTISGVTPGDYSIIACADSADIIPESNENDNCSGIMPLHIIQTGIRIDWRTSDGSTVYALTGIDGGSKNGSNPSINHPYSVGTHTVQATGISGYSISAQVRSCTDSSATNCTAYSSVSVGSGTDANSSITVDPGKFTDILFTYSPRSKVSCSITFNGSTGPVNVSYGSGGYLNWSSTNAANSNACTASGSWSGNNLPSNNSGTAYYQSNLTSSTYTYNLSCAGVSGDTCTPSVTVNVGAAQPDLTVPYAPTISGTTLANGHYVSGQTITFNAVSGSEVVSNVGSAAVPSTATIDNQIYYNVGSGWLPLGPDLPVTGGLTAGQSKPIPSYSQGTDPNDQSTYSFKICTNRPVSTAYTESNSSDSSNCSPVTSITFEKIPPAPTGTCSHDSSGNTNTSDFAIGSSATWRVSNVSGGNGTNYTYAWSGDNLSGSTSSTGTGSGSTSVSYPYTFSGTKYGNVTITSGGQSSGPIPCGSVNVIADPSVALKVRSAGTGNYSHSLNSAINYNSSVDLSWTGYNDQNCTLSQNVPTGATAANNLVSSQPISSTANYDLNVGPLNGSPYTFTLSCTNSVDHNNFDSVSVSVQQPPPTTPSFNTAVGTCGVSQTNGKINIWWAADSGASEYKLYRNDPTGALGTGDVLIADTLSASYTSTNPFVDGALKIKQKYNYKLVAVNNTGSTSSGYVSYISSDLCPIIFNFNISPHGAGNYSSSATIDYNASADVQWSGQTVQACTASSFPATTWSASRQMYSSNSTETVTDVNQVGLSQTSSYPISLECDNADGSLQVKQSVNAYIRPQTSPLLSATCGSAGSGTVNLAWAGTALTDNYVIKRSTNGGAFATTTSSVSATATSYTDTGLAATGSYTYQILSHNNSGPNINGLYNTYATNPTNASVTCSTDAPTLQLAVRKASDDISLAQSSITIDPNTPIVLSWNSSNIKVTPNPCTASSSSGDWTGNKPSTSSADPAGGFSPTAGSHTYTLSCTGLDGTTISRTVSVTVNSALSGACTVSNTNIKQGQSVTWSATSVSGGTGSYTYAWSGTDSLSGSSSVVSKTYTASGSKTATLNIYSGTQQYNPSCPTVSVAPVPDPSIALAVAPANTTSFGPITVVPYSSSIYLQYSGYNDQPCTVSSNPSGYWSGTIQPSSPQTTNPQTLVVPTLNFNASCTNSIGVSKSSTATANAFDYSLSNLGPISIYRGQSGNTFVTKNETNPASGATLPVNLTVSGLPTGANATFDTNQNCGPNPTCATQVTVNTDANLTPVGSYNITVRGTPNTLTPSDDSTSFTLDVNAQPVCFVDLKYNGSDSATVATGSGGYLTWTSQNMQSGCTLSASPALSGFPQNVQNVNSGVNYYSGSLTNSTTFTLQCTPVANASCSSTSDNTPVTVVANPSVSLAIAPFNSTSFSSSITVPLNNPIWLQYSGSNDKTCSASSVPSFYWSGSYSVSSSAKTTPSININSNSVTFSLSCTNSIGVNATAGTASNPITAYAYDYALGNLGSVSVYAGQSVSTGITKNRTNGNSSFAVPLTVTGMPSGASYSFDSNQNCAPDQTCATVMTITTDSKKVTPGTYQITVTGGQSTLTPNDDSTTFSLTINAVPVCSVNTYFNGANPPAQINYNTGGYLTWTSQNMQTGCVLSSSPAVPGFPQNVQNANSGTGYYSGNLTSNTTFTVTCTPIANAQCSSNTNSVPVTVGPAPQKGGVRITWRAADGSSIFSLSDLDNSPMVSDNPNKFDGILVGTHTVNASPISNMSVSANVQTCTSEVNGVLQGCTTLAPVTISGGTGTANASASISVLNNQFTHIDFVYSWVAPGLNLYANGQPGSITVNYNSNVTLTWDSTNLQNTATPCTASSNPSGLWSGSQAGSGSNAQNGLKNPPYSSITYTLSCVGKDGSTIQKSVVVNVNAQPFDYTMSTPPDISVTQGQSGATTLSLTKIAGNDQNVTLSVKIINSSGIDVTNSSNTSVSITTNPIFVSGNSSPDIITIQTSNKNNNMTPVGTYTVVVTGTSPTHSSQFTLNVGQYIPPDFAAGANPQIIKINFFDYSPATSQQTVITIKPISGFNQQVFMCAIPASIGAGSNTAATIYNFNPELLNQNNYAQGSTLNLTLANPINDGDYGFNVYVSNQNQNRCGQVNNGNGVIIHSIPVTLRVRNISTKYKEI